MTWNLWIIFFLEDNSGNLNTISTLFVVENCPLAVFHWHLTESFTTGFPIFSTLVLTIIDVLPVSNSTLYNRSGILILFLLSAPGIVHTWNTVAVLYFFHILLLAVSLRMLLDALFNKIMWLYHLSFKPLLTVTPTNHPLSLSDEIWYTSSFVLNAFLIVFLVIGPGLVLSIFNIKHSVLCHF